MIFEKESPEVRVLFFCHGRIHWQFTALVKQDEAVVKGQPLIRFDRKKIAEAGHPDTVIAAVTDGKDDKSLKKNI